MSSKRPKFIPLRTCSPLNLGSMGGRCFCCCQVLRSVEAAPSGAGFVARRAAAGGRAPSRQPPSIGRGAAALPDWKLGHAPSPPWLPFLFFSGLRRSVIGGWFGRPEARLRWNWVSRRAVPASGSAASARPS